LHDDRLADQGFPTDPITGKPVKTNPKTFYGALTVKKLGMLTLKSQVKLSA